MKKKIIVSSAFALAILSASAALAGGPEIIPIQPDYFSGIFIGGTGGVHHITFKGEALTSVDRSSISVPNDSDGAAATFSTGPASLESEVDGGSFDGYGGVEGGIGKAWGQWYAGIGGFGDWGTQTSTEDATTTNAVDATSTSGEFNVSDTSSTLSQSTVVRAKNDYGVYFKPAWLPVPTVMVYGKFGAIWQKLEVENSATYTAAADVKDVDVEGTTDESTITSNLSGSSEDDETKIAFLIGLGFETQILPGYFGNHLTLGAEYDYANFGSVDTSTTLTGTTSRTDSDDGTVIGTPTGVASPNIVTGASVSDKIDIFQGSIKYYFNPGNFI